MSWSVGSSAVKFDGVWDGVQLRESSELDDSGLQNEGRNPLLFPFASTSPWNTAIGSGAVYAADGDPTTVSWLERTADTNRVNWTVGVSMAGPDDPIKTVTNPETLSTLTSSKFEPGLVIPGGNDGWVSAIQPDQRTCWDFYGLTVDGDGYESIWWNQTNLYGSGIGTGTRASKLALMGGLIRSADIAQGEIKHAIFASVFWTQLVRGWVWPATGEDGEAATYTGTIPMGSLFAIPASVDITALGLSDAGLIVAKALQDYGAYIVAAGETVAIGMEPTAPAAFENELLPDWVDILRPLCRRVTNNASDNVGGGGVPRVAALPDLRPPQRYDATKNRLNPDLPPTPTGLTIGAATATTQALSWDVTPHTETYTLQYKTSVGGTWATFSTPTSASETVTGLTAGTGYDFRVYATNYAGSSPYSDTETTVVLASDSFNRADGSLGAMDYANGGSVPGLSWTVSSQMAIVSNEVGGTVTTTRQATVNLGVTEGYVQVDVTAAGWGGVYGRYTDASNHYTVYYSSASNKVELGKRVAGVGTVLWASAAGVFTPGSGQNVGLHCEGSSISVYINGALAASVTDTALTTGNLWGMRSAPSGSTYRLDNWIAKVSP